LGILGKPARYVLVNNLKNFLERIRGSDAIND
jgi:hypothetical protein